MTLLDFIVPLLIGAVALAAFARRLGVPYPAFLALGGALLALLPANPRFTLEPDLALALFVAPVLLDAAFDASPRDLRANWVPITSLVLVAVGLTTIAVACVARWLLPSLPWGAAIALGAIVAPPDASAAGAVLRQVSLPFRISVILEGESLLNDASALFIYRLAVAAVGAGSLTLQDLTLTFLLVVPLSFAAGIVLAYVSTTVIAWIEDAPSSIVIQFAFTFAVWIIAERLALSPVLTIIAYAGTISRRRPARFGARLRIPAFAVWDAATFVLNILAFVLIGLQLRPILDALPAERIAFYLLFALAVLGTVILVRLGWVMSYVVARYRPFRRTSRPTGAQPGAAGGLIVGWCGMRGIVTLAAALALPDGSSGTAAFPHRDLMLLTAFTVVLGTLVLQGMTLKPLLLWADLRDDDPVGQEIGRARRLAFQAALDVLADETSDEAEALRQEYRFILNGADANPDGLPPAVTHQDELRLRAVAAARTRLVALRAANEIGNNAFNRVETELDQEEMHAGA